MLEHMIAFFVSWFVYPDLSWTLLLVGIGLAIVFGAIWLTSHWPPLFKKHWLWAVLVTASALWLRWRKPAELAELEISAV